MAIRQSAHLWFESSASDRDFEPDALTALLGVTPTSSHRKGEPRRPRSEHVRRRSSWKYEVPSSDEVDWDDLVAPILDRFRNLADIVSAAKRELSLIAGLMIVTELAAEYQPAEGLPAGFWFVPTLASGLSAEHVSDLACLGLDLQVGLHIELPDHLDRS